LFCAEISQRGKLFSSPHNLPVNRLDNPLAFHYFTGRDFILPAVKKPASVIPVDTNIKAG
jgi:hypothetical protein